MPAVKILVAGTGGVGGYYGARLQQGGHEVHFLARGEKLRALAERGLSMRSDHGDVHLERVHAVADGREAGPVDAVLFCVKAYDNASAADSVAGAVGAGTIVCSLQNGVENEEFLKERLPEATVLGGLARIEAWLDSPGVVVQRGPQTDVTIGAFDPADRPAMESLAGAFAGAGVPVNVETDIRAALWLKLLGICGVGGVTAYCRCPLGEVRSDERLRSLLVGVYQEVEAVARAKSIALPEDVVARVLAYVDHVLDPALKSSMCRDVEAGRPLEIDALNGAIVRMGAEVGVDTPSNRTIVEELLPLHTAALARRQAGVSP